MTMGACTRAGGALLLLAVCRSAGQETGTGPADAIADPKNASAVVATVGPIAITAREFLLSYEFGPAFPKREADSRSRYMGFMINEKLIALDARERGLGGDPRVVQSLAEVEGDLATEELYKDDVLLNVTVTDADLQRSVRRSLRHLSLRWLFSRSEAGSERLARLLALGVPFDSLFILQLGDSTNVDDRSLETTQFSLGLKNPGLAGVVDTLRPLRPSAPVRGSDGWYIVRIQDGWEEKLPTESAVTTLRSDARRALVQHRADSLSDLYVHRMMMDHGPVILGPALAVLRGYLAGVWAPDRHGAEWDSLADPASIDAHGADTLVSMRSGGITLAECVRWYQHRDTAIRLSITSPRSFAISVEQMVWRMVRDRLLVDRARDRRLQARESVAAQRRWWEDKILFERAMEDMARGITIDDKALRDYYDEHKRSYATPDGKILPLEEARDDVRRDLHDMKMTASMFRKLVALKKKYPIEIKRDILLHLPVSEEHEPKAIDAYMVKKGGTFPRPAFPTIDTQWQTWQ
jgi:hypothetical protein